MASHPRAPRSLSMLSVAFVALLAGVAATGCKHTSDSSSPSTVKSDPASDSHSKQYQDFYQMVADGAECGDLQWIENHCETDPSGPWIGSAGPGYCGDAGKSCRYAVSLRNKTLQCWPSDQAPSC